MTAPFPSAEMPVATPMRPSATIPPGACDTHIHMVGGPDDFPLWEGRVEDPASGSFAEWIARLEHHLSTLGLERVVVVHSILYGGDNAITLEAVKRLGLDHARGIALVRDDVTEAELDTLAGAGVSGVRLNYVHGGLLSWEGAVKLAPRLAARGMHLQMLMFAHQHAEELCDSIRHLPVPVVFDHIGWPDLSLGVQNAGFQTLCRLVGEGHAYVKLSGVYRVCHAPYEAAQDHVAALVAANSKRCLWGSDWPHLMLADAKMPDAGQLLNVFLDSVPGDADRVKILTENPAQLYGF